MKKAVNKNDQSEYDKISEYMFGKVPPQAVGFETGVLGAAISDKEIAPLLVSLAVSEKTFYLNSHKFIWKAIQSLVDKSAPVDSLTVTQELKNMGCLEEIGGPWYIVELTNKVASAANVEYHTRILKQQELRRGVIEMSFELTRQAFDDTTDVFDLLDMVQQKTAEVANLLSLKSEVEASEMFDLAMKDFNEKLKAKPEDKIKINTGLKELDDILDDLQPGQFGIIAARPSMGKTALLISIMKFIAFVTKIKCGIVSLEMTNMQTFWRLCSQVSGLAVSKMKKPDTMTEDEKETYINAAKVVKGMPIIYYDGEESLGVVVSKIRTMAAKGAKIVFVDYLQLVIAGNGGNREQEVAKISRKMKSLAKELGIVIIALSQLSRAVETRGGMKRPQLSDIRESGSLEQDADFIIFPYRPDYHGITEDGNGNKLPQGLTELIVAKNRDGRTDTAFAIFKSAQMQFADFGEGEDNDDELPF